MAWYRTVDVGFTQHIRRLNLLLDILGWEPGVDRRSSEGWKRPRAGETTDAGHCDDGTSGRRGDENGVWIVVGTAFDFVALWKECVEALDEIGVVNKKT